MRFKKFISFICIFAMINASVIGVYGATAPTTAAAEQEVLTTKDTSVYFDPTDKSNLVEPISFFAHLDLYQGSFYSELSDVQKSYYDKLDAAYLDPSTGMPNGNSAKVVFEPTDKIEFSVLSDGTPTESGRATLDEIYLDLGYAYFAFVHDNPQLFWAGGVYYSAPYSYNPATGEAQVTSLSIEPKVKYQGAVSKTSAFISGVSNAVSIIEEMRTDNQPYSTVKAIHDYLCDTVTYNHAAADNGDAYPQAHSAGPVFTDANPSVVCEGYGNAFKVLCDAFDIPCVLVIGYGSGGAHLWNYVQLGGKWYAVDVTWDDQSQIIYDYFLAGATGMTDHTPMNNRFCDNNAITFVYPTLSENKYANSSGEDSCSHIWNDGEVTKAATCTQAGLKTYTCTVSGCGATKTETVAKLGHNYSSSYTVDKKATLSENGSKSKHCSKCSAKTSVTSIPKVSSVSLSSTAYTYNGKAQKPSVTVKNSKGTALKNGTDYSVSYASGRTKIGKYKVTVTLKGAYSGSKTLYFTVGPKNPKTVKTALYGYDDVKVSWSKVSGASGYVVYYKKASASSYTKLKTTTSTSYKKSNLDDGVKYDFKVVVYKTTGGDKCYNAGKTSSITTLKKVSGVKAKKSSSKVKVSWTNIGGETGYQISKSTSKSKTNVVATYKTTSGKSKTISATKGKTYYYKVRAYKVVDGKKIYGPWSSVVKYKR